MFYIMHFRSTVYVNGGKKIFGYLSQMFHCTKIEGNKKQHAVNKKRGGLCLGTLLHL